MHTWDDSSCADSIFQSKCSLSLFAVHKNQAWHFEYSNFFICNYINNKCKKPAALLRCFYIFGGNPLKKEWWQSNKQHMNDFQEGEDRFMVVLLNWVWWSMHQSCLLLHMGLMWCSLAGLAPPNFLNFHLSLKTDHLEGGILLAFTVYKRMWGLYKNHTTARLVRAQHELLKVQLLLSH